ncbi:glycoside hydrolase family 16 protein [Chitinophaga horti]|uniref:Glycoside hydrolase family 16 protein n=1 Tax=Chitinophaga horti TaxID=2920382 RepID=A0ABY6J6V5_9BACT|nr:glycoside hydrolase family 16 protein [Chitinophaga horti]UYQ95404.1 glycoside hydrolase family 16 protein [Chitinophaga horti]
MKHLLLILPFCALAASVHAQQNTRKLIWSDEFNYTGLPDSTRWSYETGFIRNQEPQYYTANRLENARVENGHLRIEARKEEYKGAKYTAASIITKGKADFKYGRVEVRAKLPGGRGSWPAIWMLGANHGPVRWPDCGEIDIMEFLGKDSGTVYGTMHYKGDNGKHAQKGGSIKDVKPVEDYHIYAIEWNEQQIDVFYDDKVYFTFNISAESSAVQEIFHKRFYLLINLALGREGGWPGPVTDADLPFIYDIDYVRIYE